MIKWRRGHISASTTQKLTGAELEFSYIVDWACGFIFEVGSLKTRWSKNSEVNIILIATMDAFEGMSMQFKIKT